MCFYWRLRCAVSTNEIIKVPIYFFWPCIFCNFFLPITNFLVYSAKSERDKDRHRLLTLRGILRVSDVFFVCGKVLFSVKYLVGYNWKRTCEGFCFICGVHVRFCKSSFLIISCNCLSYNCFGVKRYWKLQFRRTITFISCFLLVVGFSLRRSRCEMNRLR